MLTFDEGQWKKLMAMKETLMCRKVFFFFRYPVDGNMNKVRTIRLGSSYNS